MMEWIDREVQFPDIDEILVYGSGCVFICSLQETKWGNRYCSTDHGHAECTRDQPEWTHWMPLPKPPKE